MRVCLDIEFQDAIVCILGGGKVALRKTKQFLEAGATIYIHSIQYEPEFNTLHINKVDKEMCIRDRCIIAQKTRILNLCNRYLKKIIT